MYKSLFLEALERTTRFGLGAPRPKLSEQSCISPEKLQAMPLLIQKEFGTLTHQEVHARCLDLHFRLKPLLEEILDTELFYTIGWISIKHETMFHQNEESLNQLLKDGHQGGTVNIHAWLTTPAMEILDFTLPTSYAIANNTKDGLGGAIISPADDLTGGMDYKPMLVGEEFIFKAGLAGIVFDL